MVKVDLADIIKKLMAAEGDGRKTRIQGSVYAGLGLAYSVHDGVNRLTISRLHSFPYDSEVSAARAAITAVCGPVAVQAEPATKKGEHCCFVFVWEPLKVRDFYSLPQAEQERLTRAMKKR